MEHNGAKVKEVQDIQSLVNNGGEEVNKRPGPESATSSGSSDSAEARASEATESAEVGPKETSRTSHENSGSSIRSRISRRSTIENGPGHSEKTEEDAIGHEEERGLIRRVPLFRHPVEGAERWHDNADIPSQWSPFFYGMFLVQTQPARFR
jgi:hypothetical protein